MYSNGALQGQRIKNCWDFTSGEPLVCEQMKKSSSVAWARRKHLTRMRWKFQLNYANFVLSEAWTISAHVKDIEGPELRLRLELRIR